LTDSLKPTPDPTEAVEDSEIILSTPLDSETETPIQDHVGPESTEQPGNGDNDSTISRTAEPTTKSVADFKTTVPADDDIDHTMSPTMISTETQDKKSLDPTVEPSVQTVKSTSTARPTDSTPSMSPSSQPISTNPSPSPSIVWKENPRSDPVTDSGSNAMHFCLSWLILLSMLL